jgi:hypothetical protein
MTQLAASWKKSIGKRLILNSRKRSVSRRNATSLSGNVDARHHLQPPTWNSSDFVRSSISTAINVILREFESNCEPAFNTLSRTSWSTINQVSGQSPYASDLVKAAEQVVELIRPLIEQKKYLRNFFDKASRCVAFHISSSPSS